MLLPPVFRAQIEQGIRIRYVHRASRNEHRLLLKFARGRAFCHLVVRLRHGSSSDFEVTRNLQSSDYLLRFTNGGAGKGQAPPFMQGRRWLIHRSVGRCVVRQHKTGDTQTRRAESSCERRDDSLRTNRVCAVW